VLSEGLRHSPRSRVRDCTEPNHYVFSVLHHRSDIRLLPDAAPPLFARSVSSVVFVSPRSGEGATAGHRVPLRQRMRAARKLARKLLFGRARTAGG
jgi:hypothetical protein